MASSPPTTFDVIVIGAGPAGEHAVDRCRRAGLRTALVEEELAGGECSYWACMPSKTLLRPGQVFAEAHGVAGAREALDGEIDADAALARRNWMVSDWHDDGQAEWVRGTGAVLYRGHGHLVGERRVEIAGPDGDVTLIAKRAVLLATGSRSAIPPIEGLKDVRFWDNRGATAAQSVPDSLLVLGGGVVGVEMGQAWRRLGTKQVTILEGGERLISIAEPFASEILADALRADGITVSLQSKVTSVERPTDSSPVTVRLDDGRSFSAAELLVAVGRRPRSDNLGLDTVGLKPGSYVEVDDSMRVIGVPGGWLYAVGDLNGRALLTHIGKYQARIAVGTMLGRDRPAESDRNAIPSVIFTDPVVASVGLSEAAARAQGIDVRTTRVATNSVAGASIAADSLPGSCQLVIDTNNHVIVGATFVGAGLSELLHAATIAIVGRTPMERLYHAVPSFPTLSEVWLDLVESYVESLAVPAS